MTVLKPFAEIGQQIRDLSSTRKPKSRKREIQFLSFKHSSNTVVLNESGFAHPKGPLVSSTDTSAVTWGGCWGWHVVCIGQG